MPIMFASLYTNSKSHWNRCARLWGPGWDRRRLYRTDRFIILSTTRSSSSWTSSRRYSSSAPPISRRAGSSAWSSSASLGPEVLTQAQGASTAARSRRVVGATQRGGAAESRHDACADAGQLALSSTTRSRAYLFADERGLGEWLRTEGTFAFPDRAGESCGCKRKQLRGGAEEQSG